MAGTTAPHIAPPPTLLSVYALAYDNQTDSPTNLESFYPDSVEAFKQATSADPHKTVVALVDLNTYDNTAQADHILVIQQGQVVSTLLQQPQSNGSLATLSNYEYDMTNGAMLGGFIQWARNNFSADSETFTYVGHGMFAPPAPDLSIIIDNPSAVGNAIPSGSPFPLPLPDYIGAHPGYSDANTTLGGGTPKFVSPHALRVALQGGTANGQQPLDVVDLSLCFGGSVEEMYEVANVGGSPFATRFVASANYRFFSAEMISTILAGQNGGDSADDLADATVAGYNIALASADASDGDASTVEFPRTIAVVDPTKLLAVKQSADLLGTKIIAALQSNPANTLTSLQTAHTNAGVYYDTTCQLDFACDREDAVADVGALAQALETEFGSSSDIGSAAMQLKVAAQQAVVNQVGVNGKPWFAPTVPTWTMDNGTQVGLGIYADWHGIELNADQYELSWHSIFYHPNTPNALLFLQQLGFATNTWSQAFQSYWQTRIAAGDSVKTAVCLPDTPTTSESADLAASAVVLPTSGTTHRFGAQAVMGGNITTDATLSSAQIRFRVLDANNNPVFTETVSTGKLVTGTHYIEASNSWTVNLSSFKVEISADPEGLVTDPNTGNNTVSRRYFAAPGTPFTFQALSSKNWSNGAPLTLNISSSIYPVTALVNTYKFTPSPDPYTQVPSLARPLSSLGGVSSSTTKNYTWLNGLTAGYYELHVWGVKLNGISENFSRIKVNYAPANTALSSGGDADYFRVQAVAGDTMAFHLAVTGDVTMQIWQPGMLHLALVVPPSAVGAGGTLSLPVTFSGEYLVKMVSNTGGSYTLLVDRNGTPALRGAEGVEVANGVLSAEEDSLIRPIFTNPEPSFDGEWAPTAVALTTNTATPTLHYALFLAIALFCSTVWFVSRKTNIE